MTDAFKFTWDYYLSRTAAAILQCHLIHAEKAPEFATQMADSLVPSSEMIELHYLFTLELIEQNRLAEALPFVETQLEWARLPSRKRDYRLDVILKTSLEQPNFPEDSLLIVKHSWRQAAYSYKDAGLEYRVLGILDNYVSQQLKYEAVTVDAYFPLLTCLIRWARSENNEYLRSYILCMLDPSNDFFMDCLLSEGAPSLPLLIDEFLQWARWEPDASLRTLACDILTQYLRLVPLPVDATPLCKELEKYKSIL